MPGGAGTRPSEAQWTEALLLRGDDPSKWTNKKLARHLDLTERGFRRGLARIRVKKTVVVKNGPAKGEGGAPRKAEAEPEVATSIVAYMDAHRGEPRHISAREVQQACVRVVADEEHRGEFKYAFSQDTVERTMHRAGLHGHPPASKEMYTPEQRATRLAHAVACLSLRLTKTMLCLNKTAKTCFPVPWSAKRSGSHLVGQTVPGNLGWRETEKH